MLEIIKMKSKYLASWSCTIIIALFVITTYERALAGNSEVDIDGERKIALVNGSAITWKNFKLELDNIIEYHSRKGKKASESDLKTIKESLLEKFIDRELMFQESKKNGINIDDAAVKMQIDKLKGKVGGKDGFTKYLKNINRTEDQLRSQIKIAMTTKQFFNQQFISKTNVNKEEAKAYYDKHLNQFVVPEQISASHILLKIDPKADKNLKKKTLQKMVEIQKKLYEGGSFADLAKEYSQCPSNAKGGELGFFSRGQMIKPFEEAAFSLKPGQVSDIVKTKFGYHLIKAASSKPETISPYKDVKGMILQYLITQKAKEKAASYLAGLKDRAKIERFSLN